MRDKSSPPVLKIQCMSNGGEVVAAKPTVTTVGFGSIPGVACRYLYVARWHKVAVIWGPKLLQQG
jgi:hypothetical protein